MTTSYEDRLRTALRHVADEVQPVELLPRLTEQPVASLHRRRVAVAAVAAALAALMALGSVLLLRNDQASIIEPVERPPKVF
ncbi:MAG TPA: hypothetical protein VFV76_00710, partial [Actinomycetes bacterium]|nr:hypothetical protein [Actinomycetes bacterium]